MLIKAQRQRTRSAQDIERERQEAIERVGRETERPVCV